MNTKTCIAQCRVGDCATVRVLSITPNVEITCDRDCACLEESKDGSIQCSIGWIKKMVNFKTSALFVDYEVIMDRKADWDWPVCAADFPIVDQEGNVHKGECLCDSIVSPERIVNSPDTLFPGTKGKYRVYYETFPKGGKVASIMAIRIGNIQGRMDLLSEEPNQELVEEHPESVVYEPLQKDDMRERVERLEEQMRKLCTEFDLLRLALDNKDVQTDDPRAPMRDQGIGYYPLGHK